MRWSSGRRAIAASIDGGASWPSESDGSTCSSAASSASPSSRWPRVRASSIQAVFMDLNSQPSSRIPSRLWSRWFSARATADSTRSSASSRCPVTVRAKRPQPRQQGRDLGTQGERRKAHGTMGEAMWRWIYRDPARYNGREPANPPDCPAGDARCLSRCVSPRAAPASARPAPNRAGTRSRRPARAGFRRAARRGRRRSARSSRRALSSCPGRRATARRRSPSTGAASGTPQPSQLRASAEPVPAMPTRRSVQSTKDEHQFALSS